MLADRFPDSVRELEGGLNTLAFRAGDRLSTLTLEEADTFLRPHLNKAGDRRITVDEIQKGHRRTFRLKTGPIYFASDAPARSPGRVKWRCTWPKP